MKAESAHKKAPLAITMGEAAGIGPELVARLWQTHRTTLPPLLYIGAPDLLLKHVPDLPIHDISSAESFNFDDAENLQIIPLKLNEPVTFGEPNTANARITVMALDMAVDYALKGAVSAIVTSPIQKETLYAARFRAPGHTEYLAERCGLAGHEAVMMLAASGLKVVPVTIHMPLKDVPHQLTAARIEHAGFVTAAVLRKHFGIQNPRLVVAGLNPHAGEGGTIGLEEATHIQPALWALQDAGIDVTGPLPADTMFHTDARMSYDAALCMYHDQALIPVKMLDFYGGVNITLGLPIIRTSPDHGTALSLVGKGTARLDSLLASIKTAWQMAAGDIHPSEG